MSEGSTNDLQTETRRSLSKLAIETGENMTFVLERFASQRLLYRLSTSQHRNSFVLKGAVLLAVWSDTPYRATRDIDLLAWGEDSAARLESVFRDLCRMEIKDGLLFDPESVRVEEIRETQEYGGKRVKLRAYLGRAWVVVQVDVGFGDAITPEAVEAECPSLLDFPRAVLRTYPRETVVAEKTEAMVRLGLANSRMKDFSDIRYLADEFAFDGQCLCEAMKATFARRQTPLSEGVPAALTEQYYSDGAVRSRWNAFLENAELSKDTSLQDVCEFLQEFLVPILEAVASDAEFKQVWSPGGPWRSRDG